MKDGESTITVNFDDPIKLQEEINLDFLFFNSDDVKLHEDCMNRTFLAVLTPYTLIMAKLTNIEFNYTTPQAKQLPSISVPLAFTKYRMIRIEFKNYT